VAPASASTPAAEAETPPTDQATPTPTPSPTAAADNRWVTERPAWLGKRVLPEGADGFGIAGPTPPVLRNRRFATIDLLPPPSSNHFDATIEAVPARVAERSSWRPRCPVSLEQLAYVRMSFWGFDHLPHTGEMLINASVARDVVGVFKKMFMARFPIEEMRVISLREVQKWRNKPTGDGNVTSSFECRRVTLGETWSQHAYGLAIDINPFHNPYVRGDLVAPELASAYVDRDWDRPGMITEGDVVTDAFDAIGWGWGGRWNSLRDWMHFSLYGN
jgi:D-alanyl-D-alanine carboxypeptidase